MREIEPSTALPAGESAKGMFDDSERGGRRRKKRGRRLKQGDAEENLYTNLSSAWMPLGTTGTRHNPWRGSSDPDQTNARGLHLVGGIGGRESVATAVSLG